MEPITVAFWTAVGIIAVLFSVLLWLVIKLAHLQEDKRELESEIRALRNKEYRTKLYN